MPTTTKKSVTVNLELEKETPNTVRFAEVHEPTEHPVIKQIYVTKPEFAKLGSPQKLEVTIAAA